MRSSLCLLVILVGLIAMSRAASNSSCLLETAVPLVIWAGPDSGDPACAPGFFCPNLDISDNATWPAICPPTIECTLDRLAGDWCDAQGRFEPKICRAGYYCPVPGDREIKCPSGYYCPFGTSEPHKCPWLSICREGSAEARHLGVLLVLGLVDVALVIVCVLYYYYRKWKHAKHFRVMSSGTSGETSQNMSASTSSSSEAEEAEMDDLESGVKRRGIEDGEGKGNVVSSEKEATKILIEGFHLSRGNQPLLDFDFSELGLTIPGGKKVLHGVTGTIRHGQVTAVMGPSGAGKTTFLNTLMGKVDASWKTEGSLLVNGSEAKGLSKLKKLIGYVPQEDIMMRELSVWQNLSYAASIRLPRDWDHDQRARHVNSVLSVLDLVNVRNTVIGDETKRGVSGGQRKRVNIGMELAACPLAMFCDEPTSGLDSAASLGVVKAVKKVARTTGMTVVMVIHQPRVEIWNSLDRVLILAPGGITAFLGEQRFVNAYFSKYFGLQFDPTDNPADIVMDYIAKFGSDCATTWKNEGEAWLVAYAQQHQSGDDFDDALAESVSASINANKKQGKQPMKSSQAITRSSDSVRASQALQEEENDESSQMEVVWTNEGGKSRENRQKKDKEGEDEMWEEAENSNDHVVRGANFLWQIWFVILRSLKQQYANLPSLILEMSLAVIAGFVIGSSAEDHYAGAVIVPYTPLSPAPQVTIVPQKHMYICMSIGIAAASAGVKAFGEDMVIYWREASAGHNRSSYYVGQSLAMLPRIILGGLHFTAFFHVLSASYVTFGPLLLNFCLLVYAIYGLAAIVSMLVPRRDAPLLAAVAGVLIAVLNGLVSEMPKQLLYFSYAFWSHEAFYDGEIAPFKNVYQTSITSELFHTYPGRTSLDYGMIFVIGTIFRIIAFALLMLLNRDKQR